MAILPTVGMLSGTPIETMSLKAKIEAVIYASEDTVALAQLTGLLGHEAQAELDQLDAAQQSLTLEEEPADPDALNDEVLSESEAEHAAALDHALHVAAAEEAAHARAVHQHAIADAAAMRTSDTLDPEPEAPAAETEQGGAAPQEEPAEQQAARSSKTAKQNTPHLPQHH